MLIELSDLEWLWGPFRLFRYLSFRCVMATVSAFLIGWLVAPLIISKLRAFKSVQTQRTADEVGKLAELHAWKKNTPIMGGLIIFAGMVPSCLLWCSFNYLVFAALGVYVILTLAGFADDYQKMVKRNSKGVSGKFKIAMQTLAAAFACAILFSNEQFGSSMRELAIPFVKSPLVASLPLWLVAAFVWLIITASSNAVNLTDGVDGLAVGCTISVIFTYGIFAYLTGNAVASNYLNLTMVNGCGELAVVCCATLGACVAFLWYNAYPAHIWMGDTGSLALGGLVGIIAFMVHQPFTLILVGGVFVMEAASVIMQVGSFKLTGRRVFKMSPIHHHFELGGWKEMQVVIRFWIISLIFSLAGLATLKLR